MKSNIVIFEGNKKDGIFSNNKKFYPEEYTDKDIYNSVLKDRIKLGKKYHFNGKKMFQTTQKMEDNDSYPNNKYVLIDDSYMTKDDYFKEEIKADILIIKKDYKGIALAHRMADCPVLIAEDRKLGISAIVHCGIYHINRGLPEEFIKCLVNVFNCKDLYLYIGSHIKKESYIYDRYPITATNQSIWKDAIEKKEDGYHIDLEKAILNQIEKYNLKEIKVSDIDTYNNKNYASHYAAVHGNKDKLGQNIVGFYYK